MHTPKRYFHDRLVLLLLTPLIFFSILTIVLIVLNIGGERNEGFIVQYRPTLGLQAFEKGSVLNILSFGVFVALVSVFHTYLSIKTYHIRRNLSVIILALGLLLAILALVISNSLLLLL